jgi:hypothetical protein
MSDRIRSSCVLLACLGLFGPALAAPARAGMIAAWGYDMYGQVTDTPTGTDFTAIAGGWL